MIFMSQSGLVDASRDEEWDDWYIEHCRLMATVPGISSAQRFRTDTPDAPPSLAMYSIAAPEVFEDPGYLSVRGFREWQPHIDRRHYHRNLFAGLEYAPVIGEGAYLHIVDCGTSAAAELGREFVWLESLGLDRSTPYRGVAVVETAEPSTVAASVARYRPVTERFGESP